MGQELPHAENQQASEQACRQAAAAEASARAARSNAAVHDPKSASVLHHYTWHGTASASKTRCDAKILAHKGQSEHSCPVPLQCQCRGKCTCNVLLHCLALTSLLNSFASTNSFAFFTVVVQIASSASSVRNAMCGVRITLGMDRRHMKSWSNPVSRSE